MNLQKVLSGTRRFLKRNGSTILTVIGVCGGVYAAVKAVKDTPKAMVLLSEAETEKASIPDYVYYQNPDFYDNREQITLTILEKAKTVAPVYIFPAVVGVASIACLLGANILSRKQQASLMSAYVLLDRSFKEYRNAAKLCRKTANPDEKCRNCSAYRDRMEYDCESVCQKNGAAPSGSCSA